MERLVPNATLLVVVDVQERLAAAMPEQQLGQLLRAARILIEGARLLGVPILLTEQYPKGLGPTLAEISQLVKSAGGRRFEKVGFSACDAPELAAALDDVAPRAAIVIGMESHVCIYQTVRDLVARGLEVHVPIDGVASRRNDHRETGITLCERAGAIRTTSETVVFDWLRCAGSEEFKQLSKLIR